MNLSDFYNEVARQADTGKQAIGVSDTKRVLAVFFSELAKMDAAAALALLSKGVELAKKKAGK
jgi:hypothetical protein